MNKPKQGSQFLRSGWIPACAGMTIFARDYVQRRRPGKDRPSVSTPTRLCIVIDEEKNVLPC